MSKKPPVFLIPKVIVRGVRLSEKRRKNVSSALENEFYMYLQYRANYSPATAALKFYLAIAELESLRAKARGA